VISRLGTAPGPPCSPDLTAPDFFLWGYLKSQVWSRHPADLNALKQAIQDEIINISEETLREVINSFSTRGHQCIQEGGGHRKDTVHKK